MSLIYDNRDNRNNGKNGRNAMMSRGDKRVNNLSNKCFTRCRKLSQLENCKHVEDLQDVSCIDLSVAEKGQDSLSWGEREGAISHLSGNCGDGDV